MIYRTSHFVAAPLHRVFAFFCDPNNLPRITPPANHPRIERLTLVPPPPDCAGAPIASLAGPGSEIVISSQLFPLVPYRAQWLARILDFEWNRYFRDEQVSGPFRRWLHTHSFEAAERNSPDGCLQQGTLVRDEVDFSVGYGPLDPIASAVARVFLARMFTYRHKQTERLFSSLREDWHS